MKLNTYRSSEFASWFLLTLFIATCQLFADNIVPNPNLRPAAPKTRSSEGYAVWYRVPVNSLAHRRGKESEFTAAHNRLPLGTLVCVTRLSNGRSVLVRITDRGITNRRAKIDICWEAAKELGMLREGFSRVRLEVVPEPLAKF